MSDAREHLVKLVRLQELAAEIRSSRALVEEAPARLEEIEARFRERNAEYVALKERHDAIDKDRRDRDVELDALQEHRKKYMDSLMQVKNQREYAAVLKELDSVKAQIASHEEAILKAMEEIESLKTELDARAAHIEQERTLVEQDRAKVDSEVELARERIVADQAERERLEGELPTGLVENVHRVEESRQGVFLAKADRELCQACFVRVRPQVYQEIKQALTIHACGHCRRILYYEPSLVPPAPEPAPSNGAEAVNGGPV